MTVDQLREITNKLTSADLDKVSKAVAVSQKSHKAVKPTTKKVDLYHAAAKQALYDVVSDEEPTGDEGNNMA